MATSWGRGGWRGKMAKIIQLFRVIERFAIRKNLAWKKAFLNPQIFVIVRGKT
jgi:hypothetical protein